MAWYITARDEGRDNIVSDYRRDFRASVVSTFALCLPRAIAVAGPRRISLGETIIDQPEFVENPFLRSLVVIFLEENIRSFETRHVEGFDDTSSAAIENALAAVPVLNTVDLLPFRASQTADGGVLFEINGKQARSLIEFFPDGGIAILEKTIPERLVEFSAEDLTSQIEALKDARR
jgi:hypothetical protein